MKKLVALVLTLAMAICVAAPAMAASENAQISAAIAKIQETYPGAEIEVTENIYTELYAGWGGKYVSAAPYESGWRYDFAEGEYYMW